MTIQEKIQLKKDWYKGSETLNDWLVSAYEQGLKDTIIYASGSIEEIAANAHEALMKIEPRKTGEVLMVPYNELSDEAKKIDAATVMAVLDAMVEIYFPPLQTSKP